MEYRFWQADLPNSRTPLRGPVPGYLHGYLAQLRAGGQSPPARGVSRIVAVSGAGTPDHIKRGGTG